MSIYVIKDINNEYVANRFKVKGVKDPRRALHFTNKEKAIEFSGRLRHEHKISRDIEHCYLSESYYAVETLGEAYDKFLYYRAMNERRKCEQSISFGEFLEQLDQEEGL